MRGRSRSYSVCSSMASDSELDDDDRYSDYSDASMASSRSRSRSRRSSPGGSVGSDYDSYYSSRDTSREPSRQRYSRRAMDTRSIRQSTRSNAGLMRVVHSAVARLKKKSGAPVKSIKQEIADKFGVTLAGSHNTQRLNTALRTLQKEGKLVKTQQGYKLVPHGGTGGQQQSRRRRRRRRRGRRRRRRGRKRSSFPGGAGVGARRRRRRGRKRRRRRRRRRGGRRHAAKPKGRATLRRRGKSNPTARRRGGKRGAAGASGTSAASTRGDYTPPGTRTSPRLPSRNPSRVPSRMPSRLPSRSHSPARAQFDPRETPPSRDSPGPHMMNSLDDFDLSSDTEVNLLRPVSVSKSF